MSEWLDCTENLNKKEFPPYDSFFTILHNSNSFGKDNNDFENLVKSDLSTEQAIFKLRMDNVSPTGVENYLYLQTVWESEQVQFFADFLKWYNKNDVILQLEAM